MSNADDGKHGGWPGVAVAIGGSVGGDMFAVRALTEPLAHGSTPVAFALTGVLAPLTPYSCAKLSVAARPHRSGEPL